MYCLSEGGRSVWLGGPLLLVRRAGGLLLALCLLAFWRPALAESVLVVPGTGDAIAILRALASDFNALHRGDMRVDVPDSVGSSGGIRAVMRGEAELARTARPLKPQEKGAGLRAEPWATYPVVFYAHPDVTVKEVSSQALAAVYRGEIRDWAMLGGVPHKIRLIHREKGDSCRRRLEADLPELFPAEGGPPAMTTVTTQATLRAVREYPGALAYGPYPEVLGREYRVLELDGVAPDEPRYPLRNRLYFVWSADVPLSPQAQAFLAFIRSERGQEIIRARGANPVEGENLP